MADTLIAYRLGYEVWQAGVQQPFTKLAPGTRIDQLVLASDAVFVFATGRGHAEVGRTTGQVGAVGVNAD